MIIEELKQKQQQPWLILPFKNSLTVKLLIGWKRSATNNNIMQIWKVD